MGALRFAIVLHTAMLVTACGEPPSWQKLLALKIQDHYPTYQAEPTPDGKLLVHRPGLPDVPVDVNDIAQFCQRGPKDCDYVTDKMLIDLQAPGR